MTRDCALYAFSVLILICFTWDGQISLAESAVMTSLVSIYLLVLLFNKHLMHYMKWVIEIKLNWCQSNSYGKYYNPTLDQWISFIEFPFLIFQMFQHHSSRVISRVPSNFNRTICIESQTLQSSQSICMEAFRSLH